MFNDLSDECTGEGCFAYVCVVCKNVNLLKTAFFSIAVLWFTFKFMLVCFSHLCLE